MTRTRIKCCGMTRPQDAVAAAQLGADAIGLIFTRRSVRFVDVAQACAIRDALPPFMVVVALFMDDDAHWVEEIEAQVRPHLLQFHGSEPADYCEAFVAPYVKTIAMGSMPDPRAAFDAHPRAAGFLLDGHRAHESGGRGIRFDWSRAPQRAERPLALAGGLNADNVADAIATAHPYAVDVCSGVESAPGIKDARKMRAFIEAVRGADANA